MAHYYSFTGSKWNKLGKNINFDRINKGKTKYVYVKGILDSKFHGNIKSTANVKSSTYDLKLSNNKHTVNLKVLKLSPNGVKSKKYVDVFANCGPSSLQHLLASKGIFVSKKTLTNKLKPTNGQTSMYMMRKVAGEYGVNLNAVKTPLKTLKKGDVVLLKINGTTHYVTIQSIGKDYVIFNDPVLGPVKILRKDFDEWYTGYTLTGDKKGKGISEDKQRDLKGGNLILSALIEVTAIMAFCGWYFASRRKPSKKSSGIKAYAARSSTSGKPGRPRLSYNIPNNKRYVYINSPQTNLGNAAELSAKKINIYHDYYILSMTNKEYADYKAKKYPVTLVTTHRIPIGQSRLTMRTTRFYAPGFLYGNEPTKTNYRYY